MNFLFSNKMIRNDFSFLSADQKTNIHAIVCYPKDGKVNKAFQMIHGMIEYIERYLNFFQYLTDNGFVVVGHDHLGHGESINKKEDLGYIGEPNPNLLLIQDINTLKLITKKAYPNIPYFIGGHSMGSYLLRQYLTMNSEGITGAVIIGTGYESPLKTLMGYNFCKILTFFKGSRHRSNLFKKLCFDSDAYKKYDMNKKDKKNSWITSDEKMAQLYNEDKKMDFDFTLNGYNGLIQATMYSCDFWNISKMKKNLPILLISGACDPVGNNGKGVKKVYELMKNAGISDITMKLFENDRHEILNEINREEVYEYIKNWLDEKTKY